MQNPQHAPKPKRTRKPRGQAMVEYSMINWVIVAALCFISSAPLFDNRGLNVTTGGRSLIQIFLEAYQTYYDSYYFVLNLPFP